MYLLVFERIISSDDILERQHYEHEMNSALGPNVDVETPQPPHQRRCTGDFDEK